MRRPLIFIFLIAWLPSCQEKKSEAPVTMEARPAAPVVKEDSLTTSIHTLLVNQESKDIMTGVKTINDLLIDQINIAEISGKEYYEAEMHAQDSAFSSYLKFLDEHANKGNNLSNPMKLQQNRLKHEAVQSYLRNMIKTSKPEKTIYRVTYHLKASSVNLNYDQVKTAFFSKALEKMVMDYNQLNR